MPLIENTTKQKLKRGELALGFGVHHMRGAGTAMLAPPRTTTGCSSTWSMARFRCTTHATCVAALPTGVTPIVRICAGSLDEGTRCLDNGALGVIVPHVDTVERAKESRRRSAIRRSATAHGAARPRRSAIRPPAMPRHSSRSTRRCWWWR